MMGPIIYRYVDLLNRSLLFQGERILKLAEMCRKLETEEEKVLPFYASSLTKEEQDDVSAAVMEPPSQKLAAVSGSGGVWVGSRWEIWCCSDTVIDCDSR